MAILKKRARSKWKDFDLRFLIEWIKTLLLDPSKTWIVGAGLLFAEVVVNIVVIWKIKCKYHRAAFHLIFLLLVFFNQKFWFSPFYTDNNTTFCAIFIFIILLQGINR